jgi:hypothetical protein
MVEVEQVLENGKRSRAVIDSLKADQQLAEVRERSLGRQVAALSSQIKDLEHQAVLDSVASANSPVERLLPGLRLRILGVNLYGTDSSGVRFLERMRLVASRASVVPFLEQQVETLVEQRNELRRTILLANQRADSLEAWVMRVSPLLERGQELMSCSIDPLGLIPCPSRTTSLVLGLVAGGITGYVVAR